MGLDLYIEAKITEKATGRCITMPDTEEARKRLLDPNEFDPEACQYFTVLWMCGWDAAVPRNSWIDIINRYLKTNYSYEDIIIPFPQSALREMCSCLFSNAIFPEDNRFLYEVESSYWDIQQREKDNNIPYMVLPDNEKDFHKWDGRENDEYNFLIKANLLRKFIYELERIHYENRYTALESDQYEGLWENHSCKLPDSFIILEDDRQKFRANPQAYEWSFRIFNSF